jgi:hypothetical protein
MNKENVSKYRPLIDALEAGKTVQFFTKSTKTWTDVADPSFRQPSELYRVKPELRELWAVYHGDLLQVVRNTQRAAERWAKDRPVYTVVRMVEAPKG